LSFSSQIWHESSSLSIPLSFCGADFSYVQFSAIGKRHGRSLDVTATGGTKKNTLALHDRRSGLSFLVDTGADVSVFPASTVDKRSRPSTVPLIAANGSPINTWGKRSISLSFGNKGLIKQDFHVAEVTQPILGADFFIKNHFAIDLRGRRIINLNDNRSFNIKLAPSAPIVSGLTTSSSDRFSRILQEFPDILIPHFDSLENKHGVEHFIVTEGPPLHARARRLDDEKLTVAKEEFDKMEKLGIVRRSNSPWASPLHVVPKANGGWRPCGDYRRLNNATVDDKYPLPHIMDFNSRLSGSRIFSKIDLVKGYHQIPMAKSSIPKTAIITPFGLWEFLRMPFGLKNAAQAFQRLMDSVLRDVSFAFVYLDDILIASQTQQQHEDHLRHVFKLLSMNGLVINRSKCVFGVQEVEFLGHRVTTTGICPLPSRVEAIKNYPIPTNKASLQRFLGMINFYHRFMPGIAAKLAPLHAIASGRGSEIAWSEECQTAFSSACAALANATLLHHPRPDAATSITVDASDVAIGAQLEQLQHGRWVPIAFFSKKLSSAERKYSAFDKELLACYLAIKHFRHFVEGRNFTLYTDHKPLTFAIASNADRSPRQTRHLSYIAEFTTDLQHVKGKQNFVADALSRVSAVSLAALHEGVDYTKMADEQMNDPEIPAYRTSITGLIFENIPVGSTEKKLLCDVSTNQIRPVVPSSMRRQVFDNLHNLSHPGVNASVKFISSKFVWHGLAKQVRLWARNCLECQRSKVHRHVRSPLQAFDLPESRFNHIHIDLVGPLPSSEGYTHILTIVDRFTRWPEAIPIQKTDTSSCAKAFILNWVSRFGIPEHITSDRGPQFVSHLWSNIAEFLGIKLHPTTAYHPQANGMVERFHRSFKASLRARLKSPNWVNELPWVLLGLRTIPKEDLGTSSAEMVYGAPLSVPGEFIRSSSSNDITTDQHVKRLREVVRDLIPFPVKLHGKKHPSMPKGMRNPEFVFIRRDGYKNPLLTPYTGPFRVIEHGDKFFKVDYGGRTETISVDRLKPAHTDPEDDPTVQPPRRGRPKKEIRS